MVSLRLWVEENRILSCRLRPLRAIQALSEEVEAGKGPATPGAFLAALAEGLTERMEPVIQSMEDQLAEDERAGVMSIVGWPGVKPLAHAKASTELSISSSEERSAA